MALLQSLHERLFALVPSEFYYNIIYYYIISLVIFYNIYDYRHNILIYNNTIKNWYLLRAVYKLISYSVYILRKPILLYKYYLFFVSLVRLLNRNAFHPENLDGDQCVYARIVDHLENLQRFHEELTRTAESGYRENSKTFKSKQKGILTMSTQKGPSAAHAAVAPGSHRLVNFGQGPYPVTDFFNFSRCVRMHFQFFNLTIN